jgi:hypothetical protein
MVRELTNYRVGLFNNHLRFGLLPPSPKVNDGFLNRRFLSRTRSHEIEPQATRATVPTTTGVVAPPGGDESDSDD